MHYLQGQISSDAVDDEFFTVVDYHVRAFGCEGCVGGALNDGRTFERVRCIVNAVNDIERTKRCSRGF